jgi:DNA-binding LytR/AlgR family response regulator
MERPDITDLAGRRILIVEDEYLIAEDLAAYFSQLGCEILGPAGSVSEGFRLLEAAEIAVLDIALRNQTVFPLAEALLARGVPFVFFTAFASIGVPSRLASVRRFVKPASYARVGQALTERLVADEGGDDDELVRLLPKLRMAAQLIVGIPPRRTGWSNGRSSAPSRRSISATRRCRLKTGSCRS